MQSAKRIAAGPPFGPAGPPPGEAPAGGGPSLGTAGPGGRMRRLPGGRRRVVFVRLSPDEEAWIVPKAAAEGLSVQRFLVESAMPEGRPSLLARRALYREFFAARRDLHGACTNLNQLAHLGNQRREVPLGSRDALPKWRRRWSAWSGWRGSSTAPEEARSGEAEADGGGEVIAKVTRGDGPRAAVRYLFSAGRHNEHEDPHVVAARPPPSASEVGCGLPWPN